MLLPSFRDVRRPIDDDPVDLGRDVVVVRIVGGDAGDTPVEREPWVGERVDLVAVAEVRDDVVRRRHGGVAGDGIDDGVEDGLAGVLSPAANSRCGIAC